MRNVDAERCGKCPFYRKRGILRRERCEYPGEPVPEGCPRAGCRPRVLKYDDAMKAEIVWMEWRESGAVVMLMPVDAGGVLCGITAGETYVMSEIAPRRCDGVEFRFWDGRPGEELRRETEWRDGKP